MSRKQFESLFLYAMQDRDPVYELDTRHMYIVYLMPEQGKICDQTKKSAAEIMNSVYGGPNVAEFVSRNIDPHEKGSLVYYPNLDDGFFRIKKYGTDEEVGRQTQRLSYHGGQKISLFAGIYRVKINNVDTEVIITKTAFDRTVKLKMKECEQSGENCATFSKHKLNIDFTIKIENNTVIISHPGKPVYFPANTNRFGELRFDPALCCYVLNLGSKKYKKIDGNQDTVLGSYENNVRIKNYGSVLRSQIGFVEC